MNLKDLTEEEIKAMGYDEIAYLILEKKGKKMKLLDLFKNVCEVMKLPEETVEERVADFFELLSINKKFVMLKNGYWDLAIKHKQDIVVEEDDDLEGEILGEEEISEDEEETDNEGDIFYEGDLDNDEEEDDLKDLIIIDDEENIQE